MKRRTDGRHDALVVGGGHNGLVAAYYLARAGLAVQVLERRSVVGGCAVTEEISPELAPGCRVSTASYMASMLSPRVIADLELGRHGLRMVAAEPALRAVFEDGSILPWFSDEARMAAELRQLAPRDVEAFPALLSELKKLARYLQPWFLRAPPDLHRQGLSRIRELWPFVREMGGAKGDDLAALLRFMTGSLSDLLDRHFVSERVKRLILANSTYGRHGGPFEPGTAGSLLFHLLSGGEDEQQGYMGHVIGGMGAITQAMAAACRSVGVDIRTDSEVAAIAVRGGRACGAVLANGDELAAPLVLSNADPKRTFLKLLEPGALPGDFRRNVESIRMNGPCAKVNYVLSRPPAFPGDAASTPGERAMFTLIPTMADAQRSYDGARLGRVPDELWIDAIVPSQVDETLATPGHHVMTCFVQFVPYFLEGTDWEREREALGARVTAGIDARAPGFAGSVVARRVYTPLDLERTFGITQGNIFHGDLGLEQLFSLRPVAGWASYATPVPHLYLCGAGAHPGGGVTGAPGHNAAARILGDLRARRLKLE